jgi:hypothetical protein
MSTFDGSTGGHALLTDTDTDIEMQGFSGVSSLDILRDALAQQQGIEDCTVSVPGVPIRLVCHPDIPSKQMSNWQRKALPVNKRSASNVSPLDMDQGLFLSTILVKTTVRVEVEDRAQPGRWTTIADQDGNPLTFADGALLSTLGAMDAGTAIKRLFPRDADAARAANEVLAASGWNENAQGRLLAGDDDEDPTD